MTRFLYQFPSDDLAKSLTPTLPTGAVDANYPLVNGINDNPALPVKFTSTTIRLVWDLGSAIAVPFVAFFHWNADAGATVLFEAHTSNSWGTPDISTPITPQAARQNGYRPYHFLDRSALAAKRWLSLSIAGNAANIILGGWWFGGTLRYFLDPFGRGVQRPTGQEDVTHRTNFDVEHSFSRALRGGINNATMMLDAPTELQQLQDFGEACRWAARPIPVVFDDSVNEAQFVKWNQPGIAPELLTAVMAQVSVSFRDVSPGEAWE